MKIIQSTDPVWDHPDTVAGSLPRTPHHPTYGIRIEKQNKAPEIGIFTGQVLLNLVSNAYQAMGEKGKLTISAKQKKGRMYLSIADTGSGMSQETMAKIFDALFTTRSRGIGLGLSVSKNLAEANGGSIEVKSKKGKGSTFTLILPMK